MAKNDGSNSQKVFEEYWQVKPGAWVWRMRDMKDMMALNRGRKVGTFPIPADYVVGDDGRLFWAEVKSTQDKARFNYSQIEPGQRSAASISTKIGTPYFFFIHSLDRNQWFTLPASDFYADIKAGVKSRKFEDLECFTM